MTAGLRDADPAVTRWAAQQVIRQHELEPAQGHAGRHELDRWTYPASAAGRCAQCDGSDPNCWMWVWARAERAASKASAS